MNRAPISAGIVAGLAVVSACAQASGQDLLEGPLRTRDLRPYQRIFLQILPENPDPLPPGRTRFAAQLDVANNMLIPAPKGGPVVEEDTEEQRLLLTWRRGTGRRGEFAVGLPIVWRNGGFIDELVQAWHELIGFSGRRSADNPAGRTAFPPYRSILRLASANGDEIVHAGPAFGIGDLWVSYKRGLLANPRSALAGRAFLKIPTGTGPLLGSGAADAGFSLDARYALGREIVVYANLGIAWLGRPSRVPLMRHELPQGTLSLEYRPNSRDRFYLQVEGSPAAVRTGNSIADSAQVTGTFGYCRMLSRTQALRLSFSENGDFSNYTWGFFGNVGPDFTATIGLEWAR